MIAVIRFSQRVIVSYNDGSQLLICKVPIRFGDTYSALTLATAFWITWAAHRDRLEKPATP